jgi:hypothetical protein
MFLLCHATIVARRSWFLRNRYDPTFVRAEDFELWCRTLPTSSFANLAEPFYFNRAGRVSILGYFTECGTRHRIYKLYGPQALSTSELYYLMGLNYLKGVSYAVASTLGLKDALVSLLSRRPDEAAAAEAYAVMGQIRCTPIPGFSDAELLQQRVDPASPSASPQPVEIATFQS